MNHEEIIQTFCQLVNEGLERNQNSVLETVEYLKPQVSTEDYFLLEELRDNFLEAYVPTHFINERITQSDAKFHQCYHLMTVVLDADVVDPIENFEAILAASDSLETLTLVILGRFWIVSGLQTYDEEGHLKRFGYSPLTSSRHIAGVISGDYIALDDATCMGAVGQAATRNAMRGKGHANALIEAFEQEIYAMAAQRNQHPSLMILESEPTAREFWAKRGYRYPDGAKYVQPPLDYDEHTGEPKMQAVEEMLMVKLLSNTESNTIDKEVLKKAVYTLYDYWYSPAGLNGQVTEKIRHYLFDDLYASFVASLPQNSDPIPLVRPHNSSR